MNLSAYVSQSQNQNQRGQLFISRNRSLNNQSFQRNSNYDLKKISSSSIHQLLDKNLARGSDIQRLLNMFQYDKQKQIKSVIQQRLYIKIMQALIGIRQQYYQPQKDPDWENQQNKDKKTNRFNKKFTRKQQEGIEKYKKLLNIKSKQHGQITSKKLNNVLNIIQKHCNFCNKTSKAHKLLYLSIKCLSIRAQKKQKIAKVDRPQRYDKKQQINKKNRKIQQLKHSNKYDYLEWLTNASKLFDKSNQSLQIQNLHQYAQLFVVDPPSNKDTQTQNYIIEQHTKKIRQKIADKSLITDFDIKRQMKVQIQKDQLGLLQKETVIYQKNYEQLRQQNSYYKLLKKVQNNELQSLMINLQNHIYIQNLRINYFKSQDIKEHQIYQIIQNISNKVLQKLRGIIKILQSRISIQKSMIEKQLYQYIKQQKDNFDPFSDQQTIADIKYDMEQLQKIKKKLPSSTQIISQSKQAYQLTHMIPKQLQNILKQQKTQTNNNSNNNNNNNNNKNNNNNNNTNNNNDESEQQQVAPKRIRQKKLQQQIREQTIKSYKQLKIYKRLQQLQTVLIYIGYILLGNQKLIRIYSSNNIYLYTKLFILFIDNLHYNNNNNFKIQDIRNLIYNHLQQYNGPLPIYQYQKQTLKLKLQPIQDYLISMLELQSEKYQQNNYHNIYQLSLHVFKGYQFYAHLLGTLAYNLRIVNKQLYILDQEYQNNIIGELLLSSSSNIKVSQRYNNVEGKNKSYKYALNEYGQIEREIQQQIQRFEQGLFEQQNINPYLIFSHNKSSKSSNQQLLSQDRNSQRNYYNHMDDQQLMIMQRQMDQSRQKSLQKERMLRSLKKQKKKKSKHQQNIIIRDLDPFWKNKVKLLLCCISYYKNILYKSIKIQQYKLLSEMEDIQRKHKKQQQQQILQQYGNFDNTAQIQPFKPIYYQNQQIFINCYQLPLHQIVVNLLSKTLSYEHIKSNLIYNKIQDIINYGFLLDIKQYIYQYLNSIIDISIYQGISHQYKLFNKFGLKLMVLEIENSLLQCKKQNIINKMHKNNKSNKNNEGEDSIYYQNNNNTDNNIGQQNKHDIFAMQTSNNRRKKREEEKINQQTQQLMIFQNSYTTQILKNQYYLTQATLIQQFDYSLLTTLQQLTNQKSLLRYLSPAVADQFLQYFQVFLQLKEITKRGSQQQEKQKQKQNEIQKQKSKQKQKQKQKEKEKEKEKLQKNNSKNLQIGQIVNKDETKYKSQLVTISRMSKLQKILQRLDVLIALLRRQNVDGCGQVVRVAWEVLEDYIRLKQQIFNQFSKTQTQERQIQKVGNKLNQIFSNLKGYILQMEKYKLRSQQFVKFKQMIF